MPGNVNISNLGSLAAQERLEPQESLLETEGSGKKLLIGMPKEHQYDEKRVSLIPSAVSALVNLGHKVIVESGAGDLSNFPDRAFSEAGAQISYDRERVYKTDILIKVAPPSESECSLFQPDQVIISPLYLPELKKKVIDELSKKKVVAIAMEYLMDKDGTFPLVRIMSELAGRAAILTSAELMTNSSSGNGTLLGGIS